MNTRILNPANNEDIEYAGEMLRSGQLICIPTETVYGLAANALNPEAVAEIYNVKGRPSDNPLIVHISDFEQIYPLVKEVPDKARQLAEKFWPGPLTIILKKSDLIPDKTSGGLDTVAVRFPSHPVARAVITAARTPLAAPSANLSGKPSPTDLEHCVADLNGKIPGIIDGGKCDVGVESTVITLVTEPPRILRPGGITPEMIEEVIGRIEVDPAVTEGLDKDAKVSSPGMKYKHYAPKTELIIADMSLKDYVNLMKNEPDTAALCFEGEEKLFDNASVTFGKEYDGASQAKRLFSALSELDELGLRKAYARRVGKNGVSLAVYNRIIRSSGFRKVFSDVKIIGLTGKSGSGKSYVSGFFRQNGCAVIDCDRITKDSKVYDSGCILELKDAFGPEIINSDGSLNRRKVAEIALSTEEGKKNLQDITFPRIIRRLHELRDKYIDDGYKIIVYDAPTLFESGIDKECCRIAVVTADYELRLKRIMERDGITREQANIRINSQQSDKQFIQKADYVIINNDDSDIDGEIKAIIMELSKNA